MSTTPTNNPVPSESPRDLKFNAGKIDEFVTSLVNTYVDRFGNEHYTIEGLRWLAQQAIAQYGWILIDSFQDGADITLPNQALRDEDTGEYYRWDGALPKHVDAGSTPASSGGVGVGAWIGIGDASLRSMLATAAGAGMIGSIGADGNPTTVQDYLNAHEERLSDREDQIDSTGHTVDLAREGTATLFGQRYRIPHRLVNKTIPNTTSKKYDHFGIMDIKADGTLYQIFRRGSTHTDIGVTVYSELQPNGVWSTPVTIVALSGVDCRGASGGTAPDGTMYCSGSYSPTPGVVSGAFVYRSKDYGYTWVKVADIPNPEPGTVSSIIPYGRIVKIGGRLAIPAYTRTNTYDHALTMIESHDNGETWSTGPVIGNTDDYNEASLLDIGDGVILCVSRTGSGTVGSDGSNNLRQFISSDGGNTWTNQGYVIGPDSSSEIGWQLVSPSLNIVHSAGGTAYVLLMYTARVGSVRYRLASVTAVTQGAGSWSVYSSPKAINTEFESGYQSALIQNNKCLVNYYATTITDSVSVPTQFEFPIGDLPDYDSGWFVVSQLTNVSKNHGLSSIPSKTEILFSYDNIGKTAIYPVDNALYYNGSATVGAGIAWQVNLSGYTLRPGTYMLFQSLFGTGGSNPTSGYAKILAWK